MVFIVYLSILCSALSKFVNKAADGGITALHMAALNGYFDCVQLLLDLHANVSAVTFHYGTSMDLIGNSSLRNIGVSDRSSLYNWFSVWHL